MSFRDGDRVIVNGHMDGSYFEHESATIIQYRNTNGAGSDIYEVEFDSREDLHYGSLLSIGAGRPRNRYFVTGSKITLTGRGKREKSGFGKFLESHSL